MAEYRVDYDRLHNYCKDTKEQTNDWLNGLEAVKTALTAIEGTDKITGTGADNVKAYYRDVHGLILTNLIQLITMHQANCLTYKSDYQNQVDGDVHTHIETQEIKQIKKQINAQKKTANTIEENVNNTLTKISDLLSMTKPSISDVQTTRKAIADLVDVVDKAIRDLERSHSASDFASTTESIRKTRALIESMRKARTYPNSFDAQEFYSSKEFQEFYASAVTVNETLAANQEVYKGAYESDENWEQVLVEERQRKAELIKIAVIVVVAAVGVVVSVATAGVASPLVGAGIGALVGGVSAGATSVSNDMLDTYVRDGDLDDLDTDQMWRNAGKAAVIGAATSMVGSAVGMGSEAALKGIASHTTSVYTLGSSSAARIGTGAVIGGVSKITEGGVKRYVKEVADDVITWDEKGFRVAKDGKTWKDASDAGLKEAFDGKEIAKDGISGAGTGALKEEKAIRTENYKKKLVARDEKIKREPGRPKTATTEVGKKNQETLAEMRKSGEYKDYQKAIHSDKPVRQMKSYKNESIETQRNAGETYNRDKNIYKGVTTTVDTATKSAETLYGDTPDADTGVKDSQDRIDELVNEGIDNPGRL